jgi:transketolase
MKTLREGTDCVLIAAGYMVHVALEAAGTLQAAGISASVHDAWSMPLHAEPLLRAVSVAGPVVTLEDNYAGALGSEVASVLAAEPDVHRRVEQLFVRQVPKSGRAGGEVLRTLSLDAESVAARVREILG